MRLGVMALLEKKNIMSKYNGTFTVTLDEGMTSMQLFFVFSVFNFSPSN